MQQLTPIISLLVRLFVGGYFIYAAIPKITEPLAFASAIANYGLVPSFAVHAMALVLPWLELICALGLMIGWRIRMNAAFCAGMLAMFTIAVAYAVVLGLKIDCGCFGSSGGDEVGWPKVVKNTLMLYGLLYVYRFPASPIALDGERKGAVA
ncbi:MAG: DoxX family membrane protein [Candidatus Kapabacteria bacterium]|nr:DoxX family membrane protein [Candidatus Kapabacteria bacterium]